MKVKVNGGKCNARFFENLVTLEELRLDVLGGLVAKQTLYNWRVEGMPAKRFARKLWFDPDAVLRWIRTNKEQDV